MADVLRLAAFTRDPNGGNPAGVVRTREPLSFCEMQRIAADVGYSETAFLVPRESGAYGVRYFSPVTEVAFCGHATVAAAVALAERDTALDHAVFHTNVGEVLVAIKRDPDGISASLQSPPTRNRPVPPAVLSEALACFGWQDRALDPRMSPVEAYGGALHLLLPLRSRDDLRAMTYDFERLRELMWNRNWTTVAAVWREDSSLFHARNAFALGGVVEDPATGAAAAALGGYLRDHRLVDPHGSFVIHQGEDMGRPSTIFVDAPAGERSVRVRGWAVAIPPDGPDAAPVPVNLRTPEPVGPIAT